MQVRRRWSFGLPSILLMVTLAAAGAQHRVHPPDSVAWNEGAARQGEVIRAFGNFVVGGNYTVGLVVFTILVIINFVVITKGAGAWRKSPHGLPWMPCPANRWPSMPI